MSIISLREIMVVLLLAIVIIAYRTHLYLDLGLSLLKLGEEARVPLTVFSPEGSARKGLRYTQRKLEKEGWHFEVMQSESVAAHLDKLKKISEARIYCSLIISLTSLWINSAENSIYPLCCYFEGIL